MQETQDVYRKGQTHFTTVNVVLKKKKKGGGERKKDGESTGKKNQSLGLQHFDHTT